MMKRKKSFLLWVILLCGFSGVNGIIVAAPEPPESPDRENLRFHHITTREGLSHSTVTALQQDYTGFMWIGTLNGLNRYDGYEFTTYRQVSDDPHSLHSNHITTVYEDHQHILWVGTSGGGLHRYDRENDHFIQIYQDPGDPATLSDMTIRAILEDSEGNMWIGTHNGLNLMDRSDHSMQHFFHVDEVPVSISNNIINVIYEDSRGNLWIGTGRGLNLMDRDQGTFTRFIHDPDDPNSLSSNNITAVHEDSEGTLWIGTIGGGLNYFDYEKESFGSYTSDEADPYSISDDYVINILEDSKGTLWIGSGISGINYFDRENKRFYHYQYDPRDPGSVRDGGIHSLYESDDQVLWIGTSAGGISNLDRSIRNFVHYQSEPHNLHSLGNNQVRGFAEDTSGRIWIATDGGGLNRFDPETGRFESWQYQADDPRSIPSNALLNLHYNDEGLWMATYARGMSLLDLETWSFRHYRHDPNDPGSLSDNDIFCIYEDSYNHLWICTNGGGLNRMEPGSDRFIRYTADPDDSTSILNNDLRTVYEDSDGRLWIGSYLGDLTEYIRDDNHFIHYPLNEDQYYYNSVIEDMLEDTRGRFWLASRGAGLIKFDRENGERVADYSVRDGLAGNIVHSILEDESGILWISTNNGISRFDPDTGTFRNYDELSGIQSGDFHGGSCLLDSRGYMYFGGFNGFTVFHPEDVQPTGIEHPVVFTDFLLFNRPVPIGDDSPLQRHISLTETIRLPYDASVITFRYSALNFNVLKGNQFAYMLEGFDNDWNIVGTQRSATYTNLDPGEYVFRVMATNNDGIWSENPAEIKLIITPPFWRTSWFIILVFLAIGLTLFLAYQYRVHAMKVRNIELQRRVDERTAELRETNATKDKLLSILAHDLNNAVFGVIGFVEMLKESVSHNNMDEVAEYSDHIHQNTSYFQELLENLLNWARSQTGRIERNPEAIALSDLVDRHIRLQKERAAGKSIRLISSIDPAEKLNVHADRNMLSLVLRNLIHNALKFTGKGGTVEVSAEAKGDRVEVSVTDDGVGMSREQIEQVMNSGEMSSTLGTGKEKGTGLGLSICKDFISRNGGTLHIESEEGKGTTFTFSLPRSHSTGETPAGAVSHTGFKKN